MAIREEVTYGSSIQYIPVEIRTLGTVCSPTAVYMYSTVLLDCILLKDIYSSLPLFAEETINYI